jgi:hypothetical protein
MSLEVAWAAGLFEGEGCISATKDVRKYGGISWYPNLTLGMTDKDVVERFQRIVGVGVLYVRQWPGEKKKDLWVWSVQNRADFEKVMELLQPWFGERRLQQLASVRERADGLLHGPPTPPHRVVYDEATRAKMRAAWTPERRAKMSERNRMTPLGRGVGMPS